MREMKFRVWNKIKKEFIYDNCYLDIRGFLVTKICEDIIDPVPLDMYELNQYTGLKDKNGVEVYEYDILNYTPIFSKRYNKENTFQQNRLVYWAATGFYILNDLEPMELSDVSYCEIIGNLYETPELLKDK